MVTGHSLGAGVATILSLKLKSDYPDIRCIAYSPPGGLVSERLSEYTKSFVLSVVVGDDIIPRLGVYSIHSLKADIIRVYETIIIFVNWKSNLICFFLFFSKFGKKATLNIKFIGIIRLIYLNGNY